MNKAKEITHKELVKQFTVLENDWNIIQSGFSNAISPEDKKRVDDFFKDYSIEDAAWDTTKYLIKAREVDFIINNLDVIKSIVVDEKPE